MKILVLIAALAFSASVGAAGKTTPTGGSNDSSSSSTSSSTGGDSSSTSSSTSGDSSSNSDSDSSSSASSGDSSSTASGGDSAANVGDVLATGTVGNVTAGGGGRSNSSSSAKGGSVHGSGNAHVSIVEHAPEYADRVPDLNGIALVTGTCMGSASGGVTGPGFGIVVGATKEDPDCSARMNSQLLHQYGLVTLAVEVMCGIDEVHDANARLEKEFCAPRLVKVARQYGESAR